MRALIIAIASVVLSGCATYYQPRYGHDGVYFDQTRSQPSTVVVVDPLIYPYWSLDYFYFSRFYHPYSVVMGYHDPWFYPYPGWYYGYRPGPRSAFAFSGGFYYPWYAFGFGYSSHRPWRPHGLSYPRLAGPYDRDHPHHRVQEIDERLSLLQQRQTRAATPAQRRGAPIHSEVAVRHRLAEDRAAAATRSRSGDTRVQSSTARPAAARPAPAQSAPRTEPTRSRSSTTQPTRERQRPPASTSQSSGIDLSAFEHRRAPARSSAAQTNPSSTSAPPQPALRATAPRQSVTIPAAPARHSPPTHPAAPTARPAPAPRQTAPAPRQPAASPTRQREIER